MCWLTTKEEVVSAKAAAKNCQGSNPANTTKGYGIDDLESKPVSFPNTNDKVNTSKAGFKIIHANPTAVCLNLTKKSRFENIKPRDLNLISSLRYFLAETVSGEIKRSNPEFSLLDSDLKKSISKR